jgi:hypothetical protein
VTNAEQENLKLRQSMQELERDKETEIALIREEQAQAISNLQYGHQLTISDMQISH